MSNKVYLKAAQLICITQSAASHALQRLRTHLKDDLFVRTGSEMLATPFAEQIYPDIRKCAFCYSKNFHIKIKNLTQANGTKLKNRRT